MDIHSHDNGGFMRILIALILLFTVSLAYAGDLKVIATFIDDKLVTVQKAKSWELEPSTDPCNALNRAKEWETLEPNRRVEVFDADKFNPNSYEQYVVPRETEKDRLLNLLDDNDVKTKIKNIKP